MKKKKRLCITIDNNLYEEIRTQVYLKRSSISKFISDSINYTIRKEKLKNERDAKNI